MLNNLTVLYHSLPLVFNSVIISNILAALVHGPTFRQLHCIVLHPDLQPQFTNSSQLKGIETRDISGLVIQSRPAHSFRKSKGKVCHKSLFPYHCLEASPLICNRAASLVRGRASGDRHLENSVVRDGLIAALSISNIIYSADELLSGRHWQVIKVTIS